MDCSVSMKSLIKRLEYISNWKCDGRLGCREASVFCSGKCYACNSVVLGWSLEERWVTWHCPVAGWVKWRSWFPPEQCQRAAFLFFCWELRASAASSSFRGFCSPVSELKGCCSWIRFLLWQSNSMQAEGCFICLVADPRVCSLVV